MKASEELVQAFADAPAHLAVLSELVCEAGTSGQVRAWYACADPFPTVWMACPGMLRRVSQPAPGQVVDVCIPTSRLARLLCEHSGGALTLVVELDAEPLSTRVDGAGAGSVVRTGWVASEPSGSAQLGRLRTLAAALRDEL